MLLLLWPARMGEGGAVVPYVVVARPEDGFRTRLRESQSITSLPESMTSTVLHEED